MKAFKDEYVDSCTEAVEWNRSGHVRIKLSRNVFAFIVEKFIGHQLSHTQVETE